MTTDTKTCSIGSSHHFVGPAARTLLAGALTLVFFAALMTAAASARTTRPYQSSFGAFQNAIGPEGLAVDQASGDVYAAPRINSDPAEAYKSVISRFTSSGAPHNFTAGPDAGTNTLTGFSPFDEIRQIAIDNSGGVLNGDIYAAAVGTSLEGSIVRIFASNGASLGSINGSGTPDGPFNTSVCGVAVDQSNGAVYVAENFSPSGDFGHIWRYEPASPAGPIDDSDYNLTGIAVENPCALAVGSGSVYVRDHVGSSIPIAIDRYASSSFTTNFSNQPSHTTIDTGGFKATALAVDPKNGDLYVDEGHRVAVFDSNGAPLYSFGAAAYFGNSSKAVAVKTAASGPAAAVYLADPQEGAHEVDVFGALAKTPTFTHPEIASFGPDGTLGSSFSSAALGSVGPLAFDQGARRLYAGDGGAPGIYAFNASAPPGYSPLSGFAPLVTAASNLGSGIAVDNTALGSAGSLYLASRNTNLLYGWSPAGSPLGGAFPLDPAISPGPPNGSPKALCGAAADSAGEVWVANSQTSRILPYSSAGVSLPGTIDTSAQGSPCQLVFDTNDDLYVSISSSEARSGVWKYTAASGYASATRIAAAPNNQSDIWLALDPTSHHLYVAIAGGCQGTACNTTGWIDEYDATGKLIDEFATSSGTFSGVAVDATDHDVYVADQTGRKIHAFGPGVLFPEATARPATAATNVTATLNGIVNDQGLALSDCHFDYVSEDAFRLSGFSDLSSGGSVPCSQAAASIPLDLEDHPVSATATGLSENMAYRFRLSATNANGTDSTVDASFSSAGRPLVETTGSPVRTATTARLEGRLDPHGEAATYHFEYGTEGPCSTSPCESTEPQPAGSGDEIELVSQRVEGLAPSTTYHYRVVADNGNPAGAGIGADMSITTRASDAPLSHGRFPGPPGSDRAWEQVSLPDTGGNPVVAPLAVSDDGQRAFYQVAGGTPISPTGSSLSLLFSERTAEGWRPQDIFPSRQALAGAGWSEPAGRLDLSDQVAINSSTGSDAPPQVWRLRPGQQAVKVFEPEPGIRPTILVSEDASRVLALLAGSPDPTHPVAGSSRNIYDVSSGGPHLVGLLPDGSVPSCGAELPGLEDNSGLTARAPRWLSPDGSLLFFQSCGDLYFRDLGAEQTKLIAHGSYIKSTPGAAFFTTAQSLDPADSGGNDAYRYDLGDETLKCVTCVVSGLDADVGPHLVVAADGSRLYFESPTALLSGAATPGIYRVDIASGDLAYVAPGSGVNISPEPSSGKGETITDDGSSLLLVTAAPGLNAVGGQQNGGTLQYYRYDDRDRSLICISCPADGSVPLAPVAGGIAGGSTFTGVGANRTALSANSAIFATPTPLLPADQNTARPGQSPAVGTDVYEWRDGRVLLVSDGLTNWPEGSGPNIAAITPSGKDLFFLEAARLTPDALDGYQRLYDARIGGGIEFPPPPKPCPLEVCQGTPKGAPEEQAPGSGSFAGPGNAQPRAQHKKKQKHRKRKTHKKQSRHQAKHNRRAAR